MERPQRLARKQEHRSAEYWGARLVPRSGSGDSKGDAETDDELFEFKHTQQKGFRLVLADWLAHVQHAIVVSKRAVWEIEYTLPDGASPGMPWWWTATTTRPCWTMTPKMQAKTEADC